MDRKFFISELFNTMEPKQGAPCNRAVKAIEEYRYSAPFFGSRARIKAFAFIGTMTFERSMEDSEFDLIRATAKGDEKAFEELVRRYQNPVISFIYRYVGDFYSAQDLAQEVFLRVFQAAPRFRPDSKVSNWVFKIAYNLASNELKRRKRIAGFHAQMSAEGRIVLGGSPANREDAIERERQERFMAALGQLPENQRAALLLKINEGLSYLEISSVLDVSVSSVESLIFRARSRLKQLVKDSNNKRNAP